MEQEKSNIIYTGDTKLDQDYNWVWEQIGMRPNIININHEVYNSKFELWVKNFNVTNSHYVSNIFLRKGKIVRNSDYLIKLSNEVWISYTKYEKTIVDIMFYISPTLSPEIFEKDYLNSLLNIRIRSNNQKGMNMYIIVNDPYDGYMLQPMEIDNVKIDINLNYKEDFKEVNDTINNSIKKNKNGLILLHGEPGTGKTTYIRLLINKFGKKKKFIYIPSLLFDHLTNPDFLVFISSCKNSVLIIEDAESILQPIEGRNHAMNTLLNITDGLLSDFLSFQIIATMNGDVNLLDAALTRSGRLLVEYKFGLLTKEEAELLIKEKGLNGKPESDMSLADIYKLKPLRSSNPNKYIGFKTSKS